MESESTVRYRVRYDGRVQGVGFRMTCVSLADGLDVHGTVRNEHDGSVLLDVQGPPTQVERFLERIAREMADNIQSVGRDERPPTDRSGGLRIAY